MANTKSAKKAIKVQERRRQRNQVIKSKVRTSLKRARSVMAEGSENAGALVLKAVSELDKAVSKGIIHKNQAARKKSRLMKKLNSQA